ncbi:hypothetical protein JF544_03090 [Halobacillus kuroshimensis]|uniref:Uncharacterized protein n=1 Tax=Halobacillus kuroshimensis TaxID=302481 RepID=A0ABS3DSA0_9BACI|nr:hypothetical protein [Halobacillus kuroshimensis]MBN8234212.1 hypothetical protein [Halobacillus kuroshimensis]
MDKKQEYGWGIQIHRARWKNRFKAGFRLHSCSLWKPWKSSTALIMQQEAVPNEHGFDAAENDKEHSAWAVFFFNKV